MKIDIHTHILPPVIPKFKDRFGYGGFIELHQNCGCHNADMINDNGEFFRKVDANCYDPQFRLKDCDHHKVDVQLLSTVPVMFSYWTKKNDGHYVSQFLNDHIAKVVSRNPKRFIGLGTVPMQDSDLAIKELERIMSELKMKGVILGSNINNKNLSDPEFFPFFKRASELGAAIFVHPWEMMGKKDMEKYWLPWLVGMPAETSRAICSLIFSGVLEKLPNLKICFAHGGGSFPATIGRIEHGFNVRPDLCAIDNNHNPRKYLSSIYFDSLVHDPLILELLLKTVSEDQIMLGTDYPFPLGELAPGKLIENSSYSQEIKDKLLYKNACRWLNLNVEDFR